MNCGNISLVNVMNVHAKEAEVYDHCIMKLF